VSAGIEPKNKSKTKINKNYEPTIVGFLCNWCSYAGADLAGVSRFQYPTNIRIVRIMCSGRIEPSIILEMFIQGVDGVFIGGCHPGDCHYVVGNYHAERKVILAKKLLKSVGLSEERIRLEWIAAAEGQRFADTVEDFTNQLKLLGPSPLSGKTPDVNKIKLLFAVKNISKDFRLKLLVGKELSLVNEGNVYDKKIPQEELDTLIDEVIKDELARCRIILATKRKALSVDDIARFINLSPNRVLQHIVTLKDRGLVALDRIEGDAPLYIAQEEGGSK
jgi:coenzyme F420-reducing hydrogenase delta subunit/DNA-binding transcriptional ArsR family regulator